ncbi:phage tail assembly protein T [Streptomyces bohaiensis]|uniref:phage tail assembly protein T n=1 Tax=Streptomyces bohaiensis TaxID=1431344 RepID=UPI003B76FA42
MSSAELTEWIAYEQITGPIGPERGDVLHGVQTAAFVNTQRGKRQKAMQARDFVPRWDRNFEQSPEDQLALVKAMHAELTSE